MNNFKTISENYNMGFITPMEFVNQWDGELYNRQLSFNTALRQKIDAILEEANEKMADVVKEIAERQGFLANINFDEEGK